MKTLKTLIIATVTALSWSSFSTELPDWYVNLMEGKFLPVIVLQPNGYAIRSSTPGKVSTREYVCRSAEEGERTSYEGVFVEILPDSNSGYAIRFCESSEAIAERAEQWRRDRLEEDMYCQSQDNCP